MKKGVDDVETIEREDDFSNIVRVLKGARVAISNNDFAKLGYLSNETIHSAAVGQDSTNIIVAVLVYALSKIFQRESYMKMEGWSDFYNNLVKNLDLMIKAGEEGNRQDLVLYAGEIRQVLNTFSGNLGSYVKDVFRKAEINKAFKLYEHGLSVQQTANLLGVSLWDLSSYIGQSKISEARVAISLPEKERVKYVEDFFG